MDYTTEDRLRAIIIDDEFHGRENLKKLIESYCPEIEVLGEADSVVNGKELVLIHKPNVVFLDISMPELDGFDFLDEYNERDFMVVFVSAYEEYGIRAVKAGAVDYLLKPVNIKLLKQTVKRLLNLQSKLSKGESFCEIDKITIPTSSGLNVVCLQDIIRIEAAGSYTKIITNDGKCTIVSRNLKDFEDVVPKERFFRTHKSHIINLQYIKEYINKDGFFVILSDGSKIEISRRKAPEFVQKLKAVLNAV